MPIYEYQCGSCGHQLEVMQKISAEPLSKCPKCNTNSLEKLISLAGFQLKGTGWYATDFKNKGKPEKKDKSEGKESSEMKDSTADTKAKEQAKESQNKTSNSPQESKPKDKET